DRAATGRDPACGVEQSRRARRSPGAPGRAQADVRRRAGSMTEEKDLTRAATATASGVELRECYGPEADEESVGQPGEYPFTRGIHASMYRGRLWTMRQYAGFGSPESTNERYRFL